MELTIQGTRYIQKRMRLLDFKNPVEKDMKYTRKNRDTLHDKGNMESVIYLFYFEISIKKD